MRIATLLLLLSTLLAGCATLITGTSTDLSVSTEPPDAKIEVDGRDFGETPKTITLDSDRSHTMELKLDGYETETVQIQQTTSGWMAGNILVGGIIGIIIDAASGGMYVLSPEKASVDLEETKTAKSGQFKIRVAMNVQDDLPKIGQLESVK